MKIETLRKACPLVARGENSKDTVVKVKHARIGSDQLVVMAGPCAVESELQIMTIAASVKKAGAQVLRGGAFKPRTSPYSFQGMGEEGLKLLRAAGDKFDLAVVTELMDSEDFDMVNEYADIIQIGARNMQNFSLLKKVGRTGKPVMLKRGLSATLEEFLMAAEHIMASGNDKVILCERGIRTFETHMRNTIDLNVVTAVKSLSHLPIIIDPSHATGSWEMVSPLSRAAVAIGAHGLMIEVHNSPDEALSDGPQSLKPEKFHRLMGDLEIIHNLITKGEIQHGIAL